MSITKLIGTVMGSFSPTKSAIPDKLIEKKKGAEIQFSKYNSSGITYKTLFLTSAGHLYVIV